jgi:nitrogen-specific signal transduction histidine kinase/DNA-binding NarL/FixJ family response regulator
MNVYLIIADDRALRDSVKATMPAGDVLFFESTQEGALRRLVTIDPDVVLVDDSPTLGHDAIKTVLRAHPDASVLALTAHSDAESLAAFTLAGARASLPKPFSCDAIIEKLKELKIAPAESDVRVLAPDSPPEPTHAEPTGSQYRTVLRWLTRIASGKRSRSEIAQSVVEVLDDVFTPTRCTILCESGGVARAAASIGLSDAIIQDLQLPMTDGIMAFLQRHRSIVSLRDFPDRHPVRREMVVLGAEVAVPISTGDDVSAAILLGSSASGGMYSSDDKELLGILSKGAATALEHERRFGSLSVEHAELAQFISEVPSGMVLIAEDKTVALMNARAESLLDLKAAHVLGQSVQRLGSKFANVALRALADDKPMLRQEIRDPATGLSLGLSATPMPGRGVGIIFNEIPKARTTAKDIAYSPFWEYLAGRVAQEIKNPLVAISAFAQLLPRKYEDAEFRNEFSAVVMREVNRIDGVADSLFEFSREQRMDSHKGNLNETVEQLLKNFSEEMEARAIVLEKSLDESIPGISFDTDQISKAVQHVIQNAVEAMPEGGVLRVETAQRNGDYQLRVRDTGPGVTDQVRPLIFLPFFSTKERGMGLGLTMASRIMDSHHGALKLIEQSGGGGAFEFSLPKTGETNADHTGN